MSDATGIFRIGKGRPVILHRSGDLLQADVEVLVNTVNTVGVMGKGLARQFKRAYPEMFEDYARECSTGNMKIGQVHVWETHAMAGPRFIFNFPTKQHWKNASSLTWIEAGLADLVCKMRELKVESIAIPPLGAGLGGLRWPDVEAQILTALRDSPATVVLYPPQNQKPHPAVPHSPAPTKRRAAEKVLLSAIAKYRALTFSAPTFVEVQQLAYFLQELGGDLGLVFKYQTHGPCADRLNALLSDLTGTYLRRHHDSASRHPDFARLDLVPPDNSCQDLVSELTHSGAEQKLLDRLMAVVAGFESPVDIELLGSVHWWCNRTTNVTVQSAVRHFQDSVDRTGVTVDHELVQHAVTALTEHHLISAEKSA